MKCKSCGADYKMREPECPYCGRENKLGKYWSRQEHTAQRSYEEIKKEVLTSGSVYVVNKMLNAVIGVMIALIALAFVVSFISYYAEEEIQKVKKSNVSEEQIKTLYAAENYKQLYHYMSEYDVLQETEYTVYAEAAFMNEKWEDFVSRRMEFQDAELEDIEEYPRYGLIYECMDDASEIYKKDWSSRHQEVAAENQAYYDWMCMEADAFLIGELGMTYEEVMSLREIESYQDEWKSLQRSLYDRNGWQWRDKDE